MPARDKHLEQVRHNEAFVTSFNVEETRFRDWVVTGVFYKILHHVDAVFAVRGKHPGNHGDRQRYITGHPDLRLMYQDYRLLQDASQDARYRCTIPPRDIVREILKRAENIEMRIRHILAT